MTGHRFGANPQVDLSVLRRWALVGGCFAVCMCTGEVMWSFGVFFRSFELEFGWSRGDTSTVYTMLIAAHAVTSVITGRLADRHHAVPVLLISALVGGVALCLCSRVQTLLQLQTVAVAVGVGTGGTVTVPSSTVQREFQDHPRSGMALALVMSGTGIGALVSAPVITQLIVAVGWRYAVGAAAVVFVGLHIIGAASIALLTDKGLHAPMTVLRDPPPLSIPAVHQFILTKEYSALVIISVAAIGTFQVLSVHVVPLATDHGLSYASAALALGMIGGMSVPGRVGCGFIADRIGWLRTLSLALLGSGLTVAFLPMAGTAWMVFGLIAVYAICHGARVVAVIGVLGRLFGMNAIGELIGITLGLAQLLGAIGPYFAGSLYDHFHSYVPMFVALGITLMIIAFTCPLLLRSSGGKTG